MIFALLALCASCTRTVYKPVETVRTEYVKADTTGLYEGIRSLLDFMFRREASSDSLIDRTKETVVLKENGDTARHDKERVVYVASHREKELEHTVRQQDSTIKSLRLLLESAKSDSIPVPYPVEKRLTKWEQTKMDFGGFALGAVGAVVCIAVIWLIKKFRK
ncbi:MAG: hypothetical protein K2I61_02670 [Muribaculaceae bacterium]|nr:hypothetical protein [Muribaculaceae bacterium]